jgi:hypothetical protein
MPVVRCTALDALGVAVRPVSGATRVPFRMEALAVPIAARCTLRIQSLAIAIPTAALRMRG